MQVLLFRTNNSIPVFPVHWRIPRILLNAPRLDSIAQNSRGNETYINLKETQDFSLKCTFRREGRCYSITYSLKRTKCVTYSHLLLQFITRFFCSLFVYTIQFIHYTCTQYRCSLNNPYVHTVRIVINHHFERNLNANVRSTNTYAAFSQ